MIEWWETLQGSMGSAHSVSNEPPQKTVEQRLREVVAEVTGKPVPEPQPQSPRIGFLPW